MTAAARGGTREVHSRRPALAHTRRGARAELRRLDDEPKAAAAQIELVHAAARSRYVCRTHHEPVTWRGTGCVKCAAKLHERRMRRLARKARRREALPDPMHRRAES